MGRVKLKIKKLENTSNRQVTYSKRRSGILKKARELSILCDIDLILLMFSPTGKPTLFRGERSNMDEVITKFAQLTPQERAKRKLESLEALKKTFKKLDHDVNIQDFLGASAQSVEELSNHSRMLQAQITDVHKRLSCWANPDSIDNIEHLSQMEDSLKASLDRIRAHKEKLGNTQLMPLNCATQFQNDMNLPLMMGGGAQEGQPLSWLPDNENQHIILPPDAANFLPQRDLECSRDASSSFPTYSGCFFGSSGKETDIDRIQQQIDHSNNNNNNNTREDGSSSLNELSSAACLNLQLDDHYAYNPYTNLNLSEVKEEQQLNTNSLDYQIDTDFELPRHIYDNVHHSCIPDPAGHCAIGMFADTSYAQVTLLSLSNSF